MLTKNDKYQILLLKLIPIFDSLISDSQGRNITTFKTSFAHEAKTVCQFIRTESLSTLKSKRNYVS